MEALRLDKYLSVSCGVSRTDAKALLKKGAVAVNGISVKRPEYKIYNSDAVTVNGDLVSYKQFVYIVLNKPKGVLSASSDKKVKTVVDLVDEKYKHYDLFPVGRLDKDTTGLLIITNDGDFAHRVISPKSDTDKRYLVTLDGHLNEEHIEKFDRGVVLADGTKCLPAKMKIITSNTAEVTIKEGKYHQIKRMFGTVGLGVNELERLSIGSFELPNDLKLGESREMFKEELHKVLK